MCNSDETQNTCVILIRIIDDTTGATLREEFVEISFFGRGDLEEGMSGDDSCEVAKRHIARAFGYRPEDIRLLACVNGLCLRDAEYLELRVRNSTSYSFVNRL